jgi:nucleoside-diphosphate-sugar epimerase
VKPKKRILIAGGAGFIGRSLTDHLSSRGCEIHWLVRNKRPSTHGIKTHLPKELPKFRTEYFQSLIISTNTPLNKDFPRSAKEIFESHVSTPFNLLDWAVRHKIKSAVHFSSGSILTSPRHPDARLFQEDMFILAKRAMDLLCHGYGNLLNLHIVRLFRPYGPYQGNNLLNRLVQKVWEGETIQLTRSDGPRIQPIYLGDVAKVTEALLDKRGSSVINLAGKERITMGAFLRAFARIASKRPRVTHSEQVAAHDQTVSSTGDKKLDRLITTPLDKGLQFMLDDFSVASAVKAH